MPDRATVPENLRSDRALDRWLRDLDALDQPHVEVALPDMSDLPEILLDLAVAHEDINEIVALRPRVTGDDEARWLFERVTRSLIGRVGTINHPVRAPAPPGSWGALGRYFYVFVYIAVLPHTLDYHRRRGVPPEVSRRTLADIGRNMAAYRRRHGAGGLLNPWWPVLHLRGELYQLGRLQFQRTTLGGRTGNAVARAGLPLGPGSTTLALHVPDFCGPLGPAACDRSLELARAFFERCYPEERYAVATCHSWLLDPQLREHLPRDSNIVGFQRRFRTAYVSPEDCDRETIGFVFGDPDLPLDCLPRRSTLQRAVADHLLRGGHWHVGHGWFEL
ncbi:DUF5596 domain-containing protein [Actinocrinis puniceicyclus]|uniref:DUF5596 domain-containing protein n=1 Tax=Actinocrinis puniceicyclus TaxID=977794 RepID=A0A8J8B9B3_9ACTN|nr:acyltransferase domain-containing protein [Actinocrinis puniceicyclus]MBS2961657.1 DUF5596 domain-containing protein [Actinocrinis puniceicyclus]